MFSRYRIRAARRGDLHHLPGIERAAAQRFREVGLFEAYSRVSLTAEEFEARQHAGCLYVAVAPFAGPIGFAAWSWLGANVYLEEMDVDPRHGRCGVGTRLLAAVCQWAARHKAAGVVLSTTREVPWNEPFYRRHGFIEIPESGYCERLLQLRAAEKAAGLPLERRVIMRRGDPGFP